MALGKNNLFELQFPFFQIRNTGLPPLLEFYPLPLTPPPPNYFFCQDQIAQLLNLQGILLFLLVFKQGSMPYTDTWQEWGDFKQQPQRSVWKGNLGSEKQSDSQIYSFRYFLLWLLVKTPVSTSSIHWWLRVVSEGIKLDHGFSRQSVFWMGPQSKTEQACALIPSMWPFTRAFYILKTPFLLPFWIKMGFQHHLEIHQQCKSLDPLNQKLGVGPGVPVWTSPADSGAH